MAEPISLAASITGLISAASAIAKAVQAIQNAPRLIYAVSNEKNTLTSIFKKLEERIGSPAGVRGTNQSIPDAMREQLQDILIRMRDLLKELQKELEGVMTIGGTIEVNISLLDRVKWAAKETDVKSVLDDLLQQKLSLVVVLNLWAGRIEVLTCAAGTPSQTLLRRSLLPLCAVRLLARLVRDPQEPSKEFFDHPRRPSLSDIICERFTDIHETQGSQRAAGLRARLGPALAVSTGFQEGSVAEIIAQPAHSYQLPNSGVWFETAKADPGIAAWINRVALQGTGTLWFVEGFRTIVEAQIKESRAIGAWTTQKEEEDPEGVGLDGREGAAVVHGGFGHGGTGDMQEMQVDAQTRAFNVADETVYAVQYRKVKIKHSKRGTDAIAAAKIEFKSRWEIMWGHMRA